MRYHTVRFRTTEVALLMVLYCSTFDPASFPDTLNLDPKDPAETVRMLIDQTYPVLMMLGMLCALVVAVLWFVRSRESLTISSEGVEYQTLRRTTKLDWSEVSPLRDGRGVVVAMICKHGEQDSMSNKRQIPLDGRWMHRGNMIEDIWLHSPHLLRFLLDP